MRFKLPQYLLYAVRSLIQYTEQRTPNKETLNSKKMFERIQYIDFKNTE